MFIPAYAKSKHKVKFSSVIFLQFLAFIIFLSIVVSLFSVFITKVIAVGFDQQTIEMTAPLVTICFYYLPLIFIVTFLAALLQYKHHFATTAFSTALLNIALIASLLISADLEKELIVYYMSWGVVFGGILQVLVHIIAIEKLHIKFLVSYTKKQRLEFKQTKFYKQFYPAVFGSSSAHIAAFLDTWLASFLVSGSISYLYYANRVFQLPLALFAIATSVALFPSVAKAIKNKDERKALIYLQKAFYILFTLLGLATVIGIVFDNFIVSLLFERGSFSSSDTTQTSMVLIMYLIGLVPFGLSKIFSLWLYSHERQGVAAKITRKSLGWNIVLSLILILPYGTIGLALASSLSGFILFHYTLKEFGYKKFVAILMNKI